MPGEFIILKHKFHHIYRKSQPFLEDLLRIRSKTDWIGEGGEIDDPDYNYDLERIRV